MTYRRNNFDVTNTVDVTDPASVTVAFEGIFLGLYPDADTSVMRQAVQYISRLYHGEHPDYAACDTAYHDLQHVLDVTLASARLMDGYERSQQNEMPLGKELFQFGILLALFHDSGYLRKRGLEDDKQGAEFTLLHVSRGADLLKRYLLDHGMAGFAEAGAQLIHFTGYEVPIEHIAIPTQELRVIGNLVATADMLAQMADRCYLEKCYDRLYHEFDLGGIARKRDADGIEVVVFASPIDLVMKTPGFYRGAKKRMDDTLEGSYHYVEQHFGGTNPYLETIERNIRFAEYIIKHGADIGMLQRTPPQTPGSEQVSKDADDRKQFIEDRRKKIGDRRLKQASAYQDFVDRRRNKNDRRRNKP